MGQKVDPRGFRIGINRECDSKWFAEKKEFASLLFEDIKLRNYIENKYKSAEIARVTIDRDTSEFINVTIYSYKTGALVGRKGAEIDKMTKDLESQVEKKVKVKVHELSSKRVDAKVLGESVALSIEKRTPFKKAVNFAINKAKKAGVKGAKIAISGRLNGAEIARTEVFAYGKVPLHTLRYKIDYAVVEAATISGIIGIKVWISEGEVF